MGQPIDPNLKSAEDAKNEEAPMAVVSAPTETAPTAVATPEAPAKVKAAAKKSSAKAKASKASAAKTDKSGHVASGKEVEAAKEAEKIAPLHP